MYEFEGKKILIVGLGRSGIAVLRVVAKFNAEITAMDSRAESEFSDLLAEFADKNVRFVFGSNDVSVFEKADLVVLSPGVSLQLEGVKKSLDRGAKVVGELELGVSLVDRPIISVTGTNGKTTTTSLIDHLLIEAGISHVVAGNIGRPLIECIEEAQSSKFVLLEVSSFQIDTSPSLSSQIGVWLNATPDHLDRHLNFEKYVESKAKLFKMMDESSFGIYNVNDDEVVGAVKDSNCTLISFDAAGCRYTYSDHCENCAWYENGELFTHISGKGINRYSLEGVLLSGEYNRENMLSAIVVAELCGVDPLVIERGLGTFKGLSHRMEYLGECQGVAFYNDSKGTNVGATIRALESFDEPVVLIAGGISKGTDFSPLKELISKKVKALILIGEVVKDMEECFKGASKIIRAISMQEAVDIASKEANPGDAILLSPACASFDMFKNYSERGDIFKNCAKDFFRKNGCELET